MNVVIRNFCNKRAHEAMVVQQCDGTFLEIHCSPEPARNHNRLWLNLYDWITNLQETGRLGTIATYTTPVTSPQVVTRN